MHVALVMCMIISWAALFGLVCILFILASVQYFSSINYSIISSNFSIYKCVWITYFNCLVTLKLDSNNFSSRTQFSRCCGIIDAVSAVISRYLTSIIARFSSLYTLFTKEIALIWAYECCNFMYYRICELLFIVDWRNLFLDPPRWYSKNCLLTKELFTDISSST